MIPLPSKPWCPKGFTIEQNTVIKSFDPKKLSLWLHEKQKTGYIVGEELLPQVPSPANSNVLKYLLEHPKLIPEEWKDRYVYFFGTVLRYPISDRRVISLCWNGDQWNWDYHRLDDLRKKVEEI